MSSDTYTQAEWNREDRKFECVQNGLGQWWPKMRARAKNGSWYEIIIRDTDPFKTLIGAIRFIERAKQRMDARDAREKNI